MVVPATAKEAGLPWKLKGLLCAWSCYHGTGAVLVWLVFNLAAGYDGFALSAEYPVLWFDAPTFDEWGMASINLGMFVHLFWQLARVQYETEPAQSPRPGHGDSAMVSQYPADGE